MILNKLFSVVNTYNPRLFILPGVRRAYISGNTLSHTERKVRPLQGMELKIQNYYTIYVYYIDLIKQVL